MANFFLRSWECEFDDQRWSATRFQHHIGSRRQNFEDLPIGNLDPNFQQIQFDFPSGFSHRLWDFTDFYPIPGAKKNLAKSGVAWEHLRDPLLRSLILPIGSLGIAIWEIGLAVQKTHRGWKQRRRVDGVDMLWHMLGWHPLLSRWWVDLVGLFCCCCLFAELIDWKPAKTILCDNIGGDKTAHQCGFASKHIAKIPLVSSEF